MTLSSCSRNEPALQNRHWLKCRAGMGSREALPVCTGITLGQRATGPSSENNWSKHQLIKCTKGPGGWQHILDSTLPHFQLSFRRKQQRHVQSHGQAFGEFQECLKELQQNIQLLHLGLNCLLSWSLLQDEDISSHAQQQRKITTDLLKHSTEIKGPSFFCPFQHHFKHPSTKRQAKKFFLDITGTLETNLSQGLGLL